MKLVFEKFWNSVKERISALSEKDRKKIVIGMILIYVALLSVIIYFRFAIYDEKLYLHETVMMSEIFKQGKWIGNYGVGIHGFIFKLPIALIFLITGPNIYIATFFHVILSAITLWLFYLIVTQHFKLKNWSLVAVLMLLTNYTFFSYSITFHREIPVLFSLILFTYCLLNNRKNVLLNGLFLLLILEAKEYVFFATLVPLSIYLFILNKSEVQSFFSATWRSIKIFLLMLVPSLIYFFLMFYTSVIPINMFNASFLGLTTVGFEYQIRHTLPDKALVDMSTYNNDNLVYNKIQDITENDKDNVNSGVIIFFKKIESVVVRVIGYLVGYLEKLLYITNFSFQGIPLIIMIPGLIGSAYFYRVWKKKKKELLFANVFVWSYFVIYMIRSSHQRYILPLIPFVIIIFIFFLKSSYKIKKDFRPYFISSFVFLVIGFVATVFYQNIGNIKELFNIVAYGILLLVMLLILIKNKFREHLVSFIVFFLIGCSVFVSIYAIFAKNQIYQSVTWGINGEAEKIADLLHPDDIVFADSNQSTSNEVADSVFTYLINIYLKNNYLPIEWHWKIDQTIVPRKLDAIETKQRFYYYAHIDDWDNLEEELKEKKVNKVLLLESELEGVKFPMEDYIDEFLKYDWARLDTVEDLKNKKVYIFEVIDEEV